MRTIKMTKSKILEILQANLSTYNSDLIIAYDEYVVAGKLELQAAIKQVEKMQSVRVLLSPPTNQSSEIKRVIRMLEHDTREEIELTDDEYRQYIDNEWSSVNNLRALRTSYQMSMDNNK